MDTVNCNEADKEAIDEKVVELINEAIVSPNDGEKVKSLQKVQTLVLHHNLIDNFLDEVIGFQSDKSEKVRRFVVEFIEVACKKDGEFFPKLIVNLKLLLNDSNSNVVKRTIQSLTSLIKSFLRWIIKSTITPDSEATNEAESALEEWNGMKLIICSLIETTENEGIKAQCIKFMEMIVIVQTEPDQWSSILSGNSRGSSETKEDSEMQLFQSLANCRLLNESLMKEEAASVFDQLLTLLATAHISSVNLIACVSSLVLIGRIRSLLFMEKVITALISLHANLPPTLSQSQVNSVQKHLKIQISNLLKHPLAASTPALRSAVVELLSDLGVSVSDVNKCLNEVRKRGIKVDQVDAVSVKRIKVDPEPSGESSRTSGESSRTSVQRQVSNEPKITRTEANAAIEITMAEIKSRLGILDNVTDLVLVTLVSSLPQRMPPSFANEYAPLVSSQKTHEEVLNFISSTLAHQWTSVGFGRGIEEVVKRYLPPNVTEENARKIVSSIASGIAGEVKRQEAVKVASRVGISGSKVKLIPTTGITSNLPVKVKTVNWIEVTKELDNETNDTIILSTIERILDKEKDKHMFSKEQFERRSVILAHLTSLYQDNTLNEHSSSKVTDLIINYSLSDIRGRSDILFSVIYNQYLLWKRSKLHSDFQIYERTLLIILKGIAAMKDRSADRDNFFTRFFLESPLLTDNCLQFLKDSILLHSSMSDLNVSASAMSVTAGLNVIKTLVHKRPQIRPQLIQCLNSLVVNTQSQEVRLASLKTMKYLHETYGADVKEPIESFAKELLEKLTQPSPPKEIFEMAPIATTDAETEEKMTWDGGNDGKVTWDEESMKLCLIPYLTLLPSSHKLIHNLALVYVTSSSDVKRIILRNLESPVKGMGMTSPELLTLVESCPKGAETLVTRIIHVLTDRAIPSPELVSRVRDLYHKRVADVRFLIPVLNGLSKQEVIAALPKLIKLTPIVVKEVFNRLLGVHHSSTTPDGGGTNFQSPLTPSELLIALHEIDEKKCDMKTVIKATSLCFSEKNIYTQEVLAVVMQRLLDKHPLPVLFMRSVIQTLTLYPRLLNFTMNILQRLITKNVWNQKKVWEGFIKCVQRTVPVSFQILLQLPPEPLRSVFTLCPELKGALRDHINNCNDQQRLLVPATLNKVINEQIVPLPKVSTDSTTDQVAPKVDEEVVSKMEEEVVSKVDEEVVSKMEEKITKSGQDSEVGKKIDEEKMDAEEET